MVVIYRPPPSTPLFNGLFHEVMSDLCSRYQQIHVVGDFSYHWDLTPRDDVARGFGEAMTMLGLKQIVETPTHEKGHTLDLNWTTSAAALLTECRPCSWSDHYQINFEILAQSKPAHLPPVWRTVRNWRKIEDNIKKGAKFHSSPVHSLFLD